MTDDRAVLKRTPLERVVMSRAFRARVLGRFDDAISGVRAYAETTRPAVAVELLKCLATLQHERGRFELATRETK